MQTKSTTISKKVDLSSVPEEYHKYANVFNKFRAETLAPHCLYDLQIELEKDSYPPVETIYFLFKFKQEILKKFIDKNLTNGFICSTSFPHGVLVLFIKKKDGKRVQKGIVYWDKQNNDVPAPNCILKVQEEIIKDEGYK